MYCVKCGVELQKGAEKCPLCGTRVYHPDITEEPEEGQYPPYNEGNAQVSRSGFLFILTFLLVIPFVVCLTVDINLTGHVTWSGYVTGAIIVMYTATCLPLWFKRANPVIFVPCSLAAGLLYVLYISLATGGRWFLPFAFPVGGAVILIAEAATVLLKYLKKGKIFVFAGFFFLIGALCVLIEGMLHVAFGLPFRFWSLYPLVALTLVAIMLLVIGLCRPLRESLEKKFFI